MNIFDKLSTHEVDMLHEYLDIYSDHEHGNRALPEGEMGYFLRAWTKEKEPLYKMFGQQFILKREVCFTKSQDDLEEEMYNALFGIKSYASHCFIESFRSTAMRVISDWDDICIIQGFVDCMTRLVNNVYEGDSITIPGELTKDGHPLQINKGCKVVKMVGKIAAALNVEDSIYYVCPHCGRSYSEPCDCSCGCDDEMKSMSGYEAFRRAHSMVLNQKMIKGNLCLSIHPLDYVTMSDNECDWTSCMEWTEEGGDYRLGTIEMMNSPYIVVAYVESSNPMTCFCNHSGWTWNNKRWRQLYVVTPDIILGNRQYPYENELLQGTALKWLRQLAMDNLHYGPFPEETSIIVNGTYNVLGTRKRYVSLTFNFMYNDIRGNHLAYVSLNCDDNSLCMNLSGLAICTGCGDIIEYGTGHAPNEVQCRTCLGYWQCTFCGEWRCGDSYYANDQCYCGWCYYNELKECEICGERVSHANTLYVRIFPAPKTEREECYNWSYVVHVCNDCFYDQEELEKLFGPVSIVKDMFGRERYAVTLANISDEGLNRGHLSSDTVEVLRQVRDTEDDHKKLNILRENLY